MNNNNKISNEEFDGILQEIVREDWNVLLIIPGIYEILSEHYNNEVIKRWEEEKELGL